MTMRLIYVTAPDLSAAETIATAVVSEKLAACANLLDGILSLFHWEGKLCREKETVLILKTTGEQAETLIRRIRQLHPYECPCIVSLPIDGGNPAFLQWIESSVQPAN